MGRITKITKGLTPILLLGGSAFGQLRVEPFVPRLSAAPAVALAAPSLSAASLAPSLSVAAAPALIASPLAPALSFAAAPVVAAAPAEGPSIPAREALSSAGKAAVPSANDDFPARSLDIFWDGFGTVSSYDTVFGPPTSGLAPESAGLSSGKAAPAAPWLALSDQKHAVALEAAVRLARSTRSGRKAFAAAEQALDGASLPVDVLDLGRNWGEYDYLEGRLRLDRKLFSPGREADLTGVIAHELMHVAQHAQGLPSNALELELEAHLLDLALMNELGLKTPPNTFARQAEEALAKSPAAFIELLQMAVPGSPFLGESSFADIVDQLEEEYESLSRKKNARAVKLAGVVAQDLKTLRSKKGRAAYKEFSRRVLAELARRSAAADR
ncbi:MAG TPA: hypothetical protein VN915_12270 [Elusimicrobiota bacterium]|nr:hypothetical protein [Elusimicrobiota bacterium]